MKLSQWAKKQGIHYNTALKWFKAGKIPNAVQADTGTIIVNDLDDNNIEQYLKNIVKLLEEIKSKM